MVEGNKWYFYSRRTQSRITGNGYWQPLGVEEPIFSMTSGQKVGMKKFYVFYIGEPQEGAKTNWIMQEYRLSSDSGSTSSSSSSSRSSKKRHSKLVSYKNNHHKTLISSPLLSSHYLVIKMYLSSHSQLFYIFYIFVSS